MRTGAVARSVRALPRSIWLSLWTAQGRTHRKSTAIVQDYSSEVVDISEMAMAALPEIMPKPGSRRRRRDQHRRAALVEPEVPGFRGLYRVQRARRARQAREVRPDAVILDVMMPGMDGFGLLRRLRADGIDAPALFLTARDTLQDKIAGLTLGGDD